MRFRFGIGKSDITGPCVDLGFMGMSRCQQTGRGISMRLYSRAFVVEDLDGKQAAAVVCADLGICSQAVKDAVVEKLAQNGPKEPNGRPRFRAENVAIVATHSHSGPGGYSAFLMYNFSIGGFNPQNYQIIVDGITASILSALKNMTTGAIYVAAGDLPNCGWIRSKLAYAHNPEIAQNPVPKGDVEPVYRRMLALTFVGDDGYTKGTINWFALHPTNMGERNHLISGDNKGYAEQLLEKDMRKQDGVAAFANSCCGDISANVGRGVPLGKMDVENMKEFGEKQHKMASALCGKREEFLRGPIDFRHSLIDMSNYKIADGTRLTWPAALGYGMLNGSQEDSTGLGLKEDVEGTTRTNFSSKIGDIDAIIKRFRGLAGFLLGISWPIVKPEYEEVHGDKKIFLPLGWMERRGNPVSPSVMPVQLLRIGSLLLICHPGELTTIAGLRLRNRIFEILGPDYGVVHVEVAAYANAYASYTTTPEEYAAQHYEGASTLFGPKSLLAYVDAFSRIAADMRDDRQSSDQCGPWLVDKSKLDVKDTHIAGPDFEEPGFPLGAIINQVKDSYKEGDLVEFSFLAGHPNRDPANINTKPGWPDDFRNTFFIIVRRGDESNPIKWIRDDDFQTIMEFGKFGLAYRITIRWLIPAGQDAGTYRIVYSGLAKPKAGSDLKQLIITSNDFAIS